MQPKTAPMNPQPIIKRIISIIYFNYLVDNFLHQKSLFLIFFSRFQHLCPTFFRENHYIPKTTRGRSVKILNQNKSVNFFFSLKVFFSNFLAFIVKESQQKLSHIHSSFILHSSRLMLLLKRFYGYSFYHPLGHVGRFFHKWLGGKLCKARGVEEYLPRWLRSVAGPKSRTTRRVGYLRSCWPATTAVVVLLLRVIGIRAITVSLVSTQRTVKALAQQATNALLRLSAMAEPLRCLKTKKPFHRLLTFVKKSVKRFSNFLTEPVVSFTNICSIIKPRLLSI